MARSIEAAVNREVLRWARESSGLSLEQATHGTGIRPERLEAAEQGERPLTLRQAETLARKYGRRVSILFRGTIPEEESAEAKFRRLPDAPSLPWPPELHILLRRAALRQDAVRYLLAELEREPAWTNAPPLTESEPNEAAAWARKVLGADLAQQKAIRERAGFRSLRYWRDLVELMGILVMQDGSLAVEEMRGLAVPDLEVPVVLLNSGDHPCARAFTLLHEFGHLLLSASSVAPTDQEVWANSFAAETIMPAASFSKDFRAVASAAASSLDVVDETALRYGVTPAAAAVRSRTLGLLDRESFDRVKKEIEERHGEGRPSEGTPSYYRLTASRLGRAFPLLVLEALGRGVVTTSAAANMLGVKAPNIRRFEEELVGGRG
jgi:Zn-dependent peptidase ImmA (M78 family)